MNEDLQKFIKCDVFTPDNISEIMASKLKNTGTLLEPSVGSGNLLKFINTDNFERVDVYEIKKDYLDCIKDAKNINKYNSDFIKSDNNSVFYDNIIMNPPYIKIQDLSIEYTKYLKDNFSIINCGNIDIYYAFIIKCLNLLKDDGVMVAITPNSYLYNKSALKLRKYLFNNKFIKEIIDFKDEKVFKNASVYCCITVFTKTDKECIIYNNDKIMYSCITKNYSLFNISNKSGVESLTLKNICKITNGIATLRDKIYIHDKKLYDEACWKKITSGKQEKYIIYPYYDNGSVIEEEEFKKINPLTYNYLVCNKQELARRDKGSKKYPKWYSYGRSQSIKHSEKKCLYISCFLSPEFTQDNIHIKQGMLHTSCLCIEPHDEKDIARISKSILKNIEFVKQNSSKRSGGWFSLSSRILYQIPLD